MTWFEHKSAATYSKVSQKFQNVNISTHNNEQVRPRNRKGHGEPPAKDEPLPVQIFPLTPRQHTPRITRRADRRLNERTEPSTAPQLILNPQPTRNPQLPTPLGIQLAFQIERPFTVGDVPGNDEEGESDPSEETVYGEERSVVEEDAGPADEGCEDSKAGSERRNGKLGDVPHPHNIRMRPNIEPSKEAKDERADRVDSELSIQTLISQINGKKIGQRTKVLVKNKIHLNRVQLPFFARRAEPWLRANHAGSSSSSSYPPAPPIRPPPVLPNIHHVSIG